MGSYTAVLFSLLLISSVTLMSMIGYSYADEVIAKSTGFEDSTILELKNSRGNTAKIDSVRIWLGGDNEFKSFKTEQGWLGKKQLNGVIEFTSQKQVNPGESVKFGIKTIVKEPIINWKALDSNGKTIGSASTRITISDTTQSKPTLNQPKSIAIKDESNFRFIPEKPGSNSEFRVIGDNFVPNQSLDFYIGDKLQQSIKTDKNGNILFTSKTPKVTNDERTEFSLIDTGGTEKTLSIRIPQIENREISNIIKISLGNTPQEVKRGDTITLEGMATPNTTLTITSKHPNGEIIDINTIQVGFDGNWSHEKLFSPELELGLVAIEISDGKSSVLRNIEIISAKLINIFTSETQYEPGDRISFEGTAIPDQEMSVILEDSVGTEVYSRSISVGGSGAVSFEIDIARGAIEGTYILSSFQGNEEGVTIFGIGQEPQPILIIRPLELNFSSEESAKISIQGPTNSQVSIILIDSADREKFSDSVNLGPNGKIIYEISTDELQTGAYTFSAKRGESTGTAVFTVGLTTGSGAISVQTTRDQYKPGEQILILGNTGSINVLLDVTITDANGTVIKKIDTFSDKFGVFKIDNFRIPIDASNGIWTINAKSGGNFKETEFTVSGLEKELSVWTDKERYNSGELVTIYGTGAKMSATITIKLYDSDGERIDELAITAKSDGEFTTIWQIPRELELGEFEITVDDGSGNASNKFILE